MLLSDTVMRNPQTGEYMGLDLAALAKKMGVSDLEIEFCSTSITDIRGYNRTIGGKLPSVTMYEKGSVFKLKYKGAFSAQQAYMLMDEGIGIRRNEGFGRVLFLKDYESITKKQKGIDEAWNTGGVDTKINKEDKETLKILAKSYYVNEFERALVRDLVNNPLIKGNISNSQLGAVTAKLTEYRYQYEEAVRAVKKLLEHEGEKTEKNRIHKEKTDKSSIRGYVYDIFDESQDEFEKNLGMPFAGKKEILGIPKENVLSDEEFGELKIRLLLEQIHYDNRKQPAEGGEG